MDYATTLNIDQQGQIIIPAKVRKALQLHTVFLFPMCKDFAN